MFKLFKMLVLDQLGEVSPLAQINTGEPSGQAPAPEGQAPAPAPVEPVSTEGDGQAQAPAPKYGEFGDDADKVWQEYLRVKETVPEFESLKQKTSATERNLAMLRKTLDSSGIVVKQGPNGEVQLLPKENAQPARKTRFTDNHKALFDQPVLEAIQLLAQDIVEERMDNMNKTQSERMKAIREFNATQGEASSLLTAYFPQLVAKDKDGKDNPQYNKTFWERATQIKIEKYCDEDGRLIDPRGELLASLEAAKELNVFPSALTQAKKEGFEQGQASKKILAPVSSSASSSSGFKELSKSEYLRLSDDKRREYDEAKLNIKT
jgi:hypothetical protein